MWLLALETTSKDASVAVLRDDRLVSLVAPRTDEQLSVAVFRHVQRALQDAGLTLREIDVYAVASGPGTFTGLRVGITVLKALAEVSRKPVVAVSLLEAVCQSATSEGYLLPVVDAYRGQVYAAVYHKQDSNLELRGREIVLTPEEFLRSLGQEAIVSESCTFVGPHLERWAPVFDGSRFRSTAREKISPVLAEAVARCARRKLARGEAVDALHLKANYVRASDAELLWKG